MAGDLLIPRCEVFWGDENLTLFKGSEKWPGSDGPQSLVYNVKVNLHEEGQTPSGSMNWNPSGLAYAEYERLIKTKYDKTITVRYYYPSGPSITFAFVWAGQSESYGRNMEIMVRLYSELDGLCDSDMRSLVQVGEGVSLNDALYGVCQIFGLDTTGLISKIVSVRADLTEEMSKVIVKSNYSEGTTFAQSIENILGQNGNIAFFHNIVNSSKDTPQVVPFPPYSWEGNKLQNGVLVEDTKSQFTPLDRVLIRKYTDPVIPQVRHPYFLGPAIIDTITKTSEWSSNQKSRRNTRSFQPKVQKIPYKQNENGTLSIDYDALKQINNKVTASSAKARGASGTYGSMSRPGMRLEGNEQGEFKKQLLQDERTAKLSANLFMCPALTGIKPCDIIFIPDYSGKNMEDWIVNSVEYEQSDGGVNLSIQASRTYGLGGFMNKGVGSLYLRLAEEIGLSGPKASIDNWIKYAWSLKQDSIYPGGNPR